MKTITLGRRKRLTPYQIALLQSLCTLENVITHWCNCPTCWQDVCDRGLN